MSPRGEGINYDKIKFTADTPPENREKALDELEQDFRNGDDFKQEITLPEYQGTPEEEKTLEDLINLLGQKLADLGLSNMEKLLPSRDQIVIQRVDTGSASGGWVDGFGRYIILDVPKDMEFTSIQFRQLFFHEVKHFLSKRVIKAKNDQYQITRLGLDKAGKVKTDGTTSNARGIFEEPNAELFAFYCCGEDRAYETTYTAQVPFLIAFIETYAQRAGTTPEEAFRTIFQSDIKGDQMIYKELRQHFNTETLRGMNRIERSMGPLVDKNQPMEIAKSGGFEELYSELIERLDRGESISLPGIKGKVKASSGENE